MRVVEEYDVALLAESEDDAKARAEADIRRGDAFHESRTAGHPRLVSVEALAVERYADLE